MNGVINAAGMAAVMLKVGLACINPRFEGEASQADRTAARAALDARYLIQRAQKKALERRGQTAAKALTYFKFRFLRRPQTSQPGGHQ
ncbi:hypothetical protein [Limnohabitans sp. Rim8]|uniref:hypothetical protein n=1 Tax=Limnohabitans sp. Rim8 TaxID=1100718 RepID=UPI003305D9C5